MNHLWKNTLLFLFSFAILIVGFSVVAQTCDPKSSRYCNPLGSVDDVIILTKNILGYLLQITLPLAVLGIIISGLLYVFAAASGNPGKTQTAKKTFTYILIGTILVVGANAIALAVITFLQTLP